MKGRDLYGLMFVLLGLGIFMYGVDSQMSAEVLWTSCPIPICGPRKLILQCEKNYKININNVTSGRDELFDRRSFTNLQRMCMGMTTCDPGQVNFCTQHNNVQFIVNYTCVHESEIENTCGSAGFYVSDKKSGFITSPNYPSETNYRYCKWRISVPPQHFVHIFIHEISSSNNQCDGIIFHSKNTCGKPFPTYAICDQSEINTISACADTEIILPFANKNPLRFWLSYYVLPVSDIRYASLYDVDLTCSVTHKENFVYSEFYNRTVLHHPEEETIENTTTLVRSKEEPVEDESYAMYIGLGVGLILLIIILLIVVIVYLRYRAVKREDKSISGSTSQNNVSDIQSRPLPDTNDTSTSSRYISKSDDEPVLQPAYSVVADEIHPLEMTSANMPASTYNTYAEIEELSEGGEKPKTKLMSKRSIDSSKRQLPEKPDEEPLANHYYDIEVKDTNTEKKKSEVEPTVDVVNKNKKNIERKYPNFFYKKKMSNASNIYAECEDIMSTEKEKTYMDMSHRKMYDGEYVPHGESAKSKDSKDKVNLSKRSLVKGPNSTYAECADMGKADEPSMKGGNKSKYESVTSDSYSDDDISMVENELYEPFESAKV